MHSINVGRAARYIAEKTNVLDPDKAYIVGVLHDIGRRVGIVNIPKHVYEGYHYCMERGWDEPAKICMTHSYIAMQDEFDYEPVTKEEIEIKEYITFTCSMEATSKIKCLGLKKRFTRILKSFYQAFCSFRTDTAINLMRQQVCHRR